MALRSPFTRLLLRPTHSLLPRPHRFPIPRQLHTTRAPSLAREQSKPDDLFDLDADEDSETFNADWSQTKSATRLAPVSPSYFTGSSNFFDNFLNLTALLRQCQTLPTLPRDEVPKPRWQSLAQFRGTIGSPVKNAKYKKILHMLNRLNQVDPALLPEPVKVALDTYRRPEHQVPKQGKDREVDALGRAYGLGRRKTSSAKVYLLEGSGKIMVNGKPLLEVFARPHDRESVLWPLIVTERTDKYNVWATVEGGGTTGQAEAIVLGIGRALLVHEPALKPALRKAGCVTRDPRMVERKKPGHLKARKMPTWVKR